MVNEQKLLELLTGAIDAIDGGCTHCILNFIDNANDIFERNNIPYRYEIDQSGKYWGTNVVITEVNDE